MKRTTKKVISILLVAVMIYGTAAITGYLDLTFKAEAATSGTCGENLTWSFDEKTGNLTISGTGEMTDFLSLNAQPWNNNQSDILSVDILDGVTSVGNHAFSYCRNLISVSLGSTLKRIGNDAFSFTNISNIIIPNGVSSIGNNAFYGCHKLSDVILPDSIMHIGFKAFELTDYFDNAERDNGVLYIGNHLISSRSTPDTPEKYRIKEGTITIANRAFSGCYFLKEIIIPDSVVNIGEEAFYICKNLTKVSIGKSIKTIEYGAFHSCEKLEKIEILGTALHIKENFEGTAYFNEEKNWENGVLYIGNHLVNGFYAEGTCVIKEGIKTIADMAFCNQKNLNRIILPNSLENIGNEAFIFQSSLEFVHIPESVNNIGLNILKDSSGYICSDTENCYAKEYAEKNGIVFNVCKEHSLDIFVSDGIIKLPTTTTIGYGDSIILHAGVQNLPDGVKITWSANNNNFEIVEISADGMSCKITPKSNGNTTFTATISDADGNIIAEDEQEMTSKAGLWQKIVAFFKKLFGATKTYPQIKY